MAAACDTTVCGIHPIILTAHSFATDTQRASRLTHSIFQSTLRSSTNTPSWGYLSIASLSGDLKARGGDDFDKVDMEVLSQTKIWGQYGHFLCHVYKITKPGKDKGASPSTRRWAFQIFSSLLNMAKGAHHPLNLRGVG